MDENKHPFLSSLMKRKKRVRLEGPYNEYYDAVAERYVLAQVILYLLLLVFVTVMAISHASSLTYNNLYYFFKDLSASMENWDASVGDRIVYSSGSNESFSSFRGGFVVAGDRYVSAYTATGRRTFREPINMENPMLTCSGKYILVYDRSGKSVMLCNSFSRIFGQEYEYTVSTAKVSGSGTFCVVTDGERTASVLYVYGSNLSLLNTVNIRNYVTSVALNDNGTRCAYLSAKAEEGYFLTTATVFRIGSDEILTNAQIVGYIYQCEFLDDGRLLCIGSEGISVLSENGSVETFSLSGTFLSFDLTGDGCAAVCRNEDGTHSVFVFNGSGYTSYLLTDSVFAVRYTEGYVLLTKSDGILRISPDGEESFVPCHTENATVCVCSTDSCYLCRENAAEYKVFP